MAQQRESPATISGRSASAHHKASGPDARGELRTENASIGMTLFHRDDDGREASGVIATAREVQRLSGGDDGGPERARFLLNADRFAHPDHIDLLDYTEGCVVSAASLFSRLYDVGTIDETVVRYETLQALYAISWSDFYAHLLAGHVRAVAQRRHEFMLHASLLLCRLPHVIRRVEEIRLATFPSVVVECAVRAVSSFPGLALSEFSPGLTWFTTLLRSLREINLIGADFVEQDIASIPLPPLFIHSEALVCTTADDVAAVVDRLCSESSGADLRTDLAPVLLDLALTQATTISRVQRVVIQRLLPRLLDPKFNLCVSTLNACLSRLTTSSALEIIAMHGQHGPLTTLLLEHWSIRCPAWPTSEPADDVRAYQEAVELVSRLQFILLYIDWRFGSPTTEMAGFRVAILTSDPISIDDVKDVGFNLANMVSQQSTDFAAFCDAIRSTASMFTLTKLLRTVRLVILPNLYTKMVSQEGHLLFLRALLVALPFLVTVVVEHMAKAVDSDCQLKNPIGGHLGVWQCVLNAIQRLNVPIIGHLYREKIALVLSKGAVFADTDFTSSLGSVHLTAIARSGDPRILLLKHGHFLIKSHIGTMSSAWKDIEQHLPVFRYCLQRLTPSEFLDGLLTGPQPRSGSDPAATPRTYDLRGFEAIAAIIVATGGQPLARAFIPMYAKAPIVICLLLVLSDCPPSDYVSLWSVAVVDAEKGRDDISTMLAQLPVAFNALRDQPNLALRWAKALWGRGRTTQALAMLRPSDPDHARLAKRVLKAAVNDDVAGRVHDCDDSDKIMALVREYRQILYGLEE